MSRLLLPLALLAVVPIPLTAADPILPADTAPADDTAVPLRDARALFKQGKYAEAAAKFAALQGAAPLTQDEVAAWAYCRVRVAADTLNQPACDAATAARAETDVNEALKLAPTNAELLKVGQAVLSIARQKSGGRRDTAGTPAPVVQVGGEAIETPSFTIRFQGNRKLAEDVAKAAEAKRVDLFTRWSGPPGGAWSPRCEIVLHPTADAYAQATGKQAQATGHATVQLAGGKATGRRIDLRADDAGVVENTLPRELMHVVLADLFPHAPPPRWAEEGMAVLAGSTEEAGRYTRTLARCYNQGELFTLAALIDMKDFPAAEKITGFYCGSVSLVEFLVKRGGERGFTLFLRDCQRYSPATALKQHYQFDSPKTLQDAWLRAALEAGRNPTP